MAGGADQRQVAEVRRTRTPPVGDKGRRRRHQRRCDQRLTTDATLHDIIRTLAPAAREALNTAPHGRRQRRKMGRAEGPGRTSAPRRSHCDARSTTRHHHRKGRRTRTPLLGEYGRRRRHQRRCNQRLTTDAALHDTPPRTDAGCTRGAEYSASGPAPAGKKNREKDMARGSESKTPHRDEQPWRTRGGPTATPAA